MTGNRAINICFHGIGTPARVLEPGEAQYWISVDQFDEMLDEIATWPQVRISFDDGNASDIQIGLEALVARDLTATFFVLAGRIGTPGSLDEADVRELRRNQMTIGTHGMDHKTWCGMGLSTRNRELIEARHRISDLVGVSVDEAALPLGRYDRKLLTDLRRLGYSAVHTSDRRSARVGSWLQPRFSVRTSDTPATLRDIALKPPSFLLRMENATKGVAKRLR
jgi:peptidoglycan/xylan/chitin deacetylase (PgdA/CDA1 family)